MYNISEIIRNRVIFKKYKRSHLREKKGGIFPKIRPDNYSIFNLTNE